jgi:hypothetical protein
MVVSHERSGTHLLMNALARGYGYESVPWIDFEPQGMPLNYFEAGAVERALVRLGDQRFANIVKSHHAADFFDGVIDRVLDRFLVFYIYRDPVDVMLSYWRFAWQWPWREAPRRDDPLAFAGAEPEGRMMQYQMVQRRSVLARWAMHVEGWRDLAADRPRLRLVSYESLRDAYPGTLTSFGKAIGRLPSDTTPPRRDVNIVRGSGGRALAPPAEAIVAELRALARAEAGATMQALGYG